MKQFQVKESGGLKIRFLNEREGMSKLDKCQNASLGNASLPEIHQGKDVDMLMDGTLGDVNDDQVSNSSLQVDKPSPTGSDSSRCISNANLPRQMADEIILEILQLPKRME